MFESQQAVEAFDFYRKQMAACDTQLKCMAATSFHEAEGCEGDKVRCERWFDPQKGGAAFIPDILVANGQLIR